MSPPLAPPLPWYAVVRMGLFQMGLGIMSVLTLGVLNRLLIDELKVPALLAAGAIAVHQFMAPARVWFGQMSDAKPIGGYHRTGYVWMGTIGFTLAAFLAVQAIWQLNASIVAVGWTFASYAWVGILGGIFALYGLALSASSTPFAALLVDVSNENNRSRIVSTVWSMLMIGIIAGAIVSSILLKRLGIEAPIQDIQTDVNRLFIIVPAVVVGMAIVALVGIEKKYSQFAARTRYPASGREDQITFKQAMSVLLASRQTGIFFFFLLVMSISLFMQDAVLEPYGGEVFGMAISDTTKLNAYFGMGTLLGIAASGFALVPRLGKKNTVKLGCLTVAACFVILILAGWTGLPVLLMSAVSLFGCCSGVLTAGAISLMLDLTAAETAGTFIGAWGLAQAIARGSATVLGGAVLDLGRSLFTLPVLAYGTVFAVQAVGMVAALTLLRRVDIQEFQTSTRRAIQAVMSNDFDD
ncbi:MAG: BCD family MFS transporter [Cyanobacteria bacterium P01_D01_bin.123]